MQLEAKERGMHKYAEEWEAKRKTLEGVLEILREEANTQGKIGE